MEKIENALEKNKPKILLQPPRLDNPKWLRPKIRTVVRDTQKKTTQETQKPPRKQWPFFLFLRESTLSSHRKNWEEEPDEAMKISREKEKNEKEEGDDQTCMSMEEEKETLKILEKEAQPSLHMRERAHLNFGKVPNEDNNPKIPRNCFYSKALKNPHQNQYPYPTFGPHLTLPTPLIPLGPLSYNFHNPIPIKQNSHNPISYNSHNPTGPQNFHNPMSSNTYPIKQGPIIPMSLNCQSQSSPWIFDCGATDTMTFDPSDLRSTVTTSRTHIQTANGEYVSVDRAGSVDVSPSLHLKNCLLVPNLSHKLLSVSQLTKELNCIVIMSSTDCVVQDAQTGKIIGRGTERGGLYYVDEATQKVHTLLAHGSPDHQMWMWHRRLGHPSLGLKTRYDLGKHPRVYNDLLDVILDVKEEQRDEINQHHVHHLLLDLLGAGMDTTSKSIEWAMAELFRNPDVLHKLQDEIDRVVGKGETVQESHISQLPYLQAIVKETLRLHPAAPLLLPRKVDQHIEIQGYNLPKGAMLIVNAWAIGRDPQTWAEPDSFYPERFLGSDLDVKSQFSKMFTFGAGKKICVGMCLAMRMISLVLGNLVCSFDWKLDQLLEQDLDMDDYYGITIKKAKSLRAFPIRR